MERVGKAVPADYKAGKLPDYMDSVTKTADAMDKTVGVFTTLRNSDVSFKDLAERAQELINAVRDFMARVSVAVPKDYKEKLLPDYMDGVSKSTDALAKSIGFFDTLEKSKVSFKDLSNRAQELINAVADVMARMGVAVPEDFAAKAMPAYLDNLVKAADALTKSGEFFTVLDKSKTSYKDQADKAQELVNAVADVMARIGLAVPKDFNAGTLPTFMDTATKVFDALAKAVTFLTSAAGAGKLADSTLVQTIVTKVVTLVTDFRQALQDANIALNEADTEAMILQASIADSMGKVVDAASKGLDLLLKLGEYQKPKTDPSSVFGVLMGFLRNVLTQFAAAREEFAALATDETAALSDTISKTVAGFGVALDFFLKLQDYKGVSPTSITSFIGSLRIILDKLKMLPDVIAPELMDIAKEFGEKMGPAFNTLTSALGFFAALTGDEETDKDGKKTGKKGFVAPSAETIQEFINALQALIVKLRDGLLNTIAPETNELAQQFGEKMGPAIDAISKALDIFLKIQGDGKEGGLKPIDPDAIGALVGSIYIMLHHWKNVLQGGEFQGDFAQQSTLFAGTVNEVLTIIGDIVNLADKIGGLSGEGLAALPVLMNQIATTMSQVMGVQITQSAGNVSQSMGEMSQKSNDSLNDIKSGVQETFNWVNSELARQALGQDEDTFVYLWGGKDLKKSLWARVISMFNGKAGARWFIIEAIKGLFDGMILWLESRGMEFFEGWGAAIKKMRDDTLTAIGEIQAAFASINGATIAVNVSVNLPAAPPQLATGGIVPYRSGGTLVTMSEEETEVVIPLSRLDELNGGKSKASSKTENNYNIRNVNVNKVTDLSQQREMRRQRTRDRS
jgi:hypothetical protein